MNVWTKRGYDIFSPTDAAGLLRSVLNGEVQVWSTEVERAVYYAMVSGNLAYATKADLDADLDHEGGTVAWVVADTEALNGIYVKSGASGSGSWTKERNLPTGPQGDVGGVAYRFDAGTADADPGAGLIRANNADLSAATELYVSKTNRYGDDLSGFLATFAGSTSSHKGYLVLTAPDSETQAAFGVTGVADAAGYVKLAVTGQGGATAFSDAERLIFLFSRTGNAGDLNGVTPGVTGLAVLGAEGVPDFWDAIEAGLPLNLYVDPAGSDSNDGLTSGAPFATIQKAFDVLATFGPVLPGSWTINLAAGTYSQFAVLQEGLRSVNRIVIKGPDVSRGQPTAIIDGTSGAYMHGLYFSKDAYIELRDILVQNFTTGGYGVLFNRIGWDVNLYNVWSENNTYGAGFVGTGIVQWRWGKVANNLQSGIICQDRARYTLGWGATTVYSGTGAFLETDGLYVYGNASRGIDLSRLSYGYVQRCLVEGNGAGAYMHLVMRARLWESHFKGNTVGFVCRDNSALNQSASTFEANVVDFQFINGGVSVNAPLGQVQNLGTVVHLGSRVSDAAQPATVGAFVEHVPGFATLPASSLRSSRGKLRVRAFGAMTKGSSASGRDYSIRIYVGGNFVGLITVPSIDAVSGSIEIEMEISAISETAQRGYIKLTSASKAYLLAVNTTRDFSVDSAITIWTSRGDVSDTLLVSYAGAELFGEMS